MSNRQPPHATDDPLRMSDPVPGWPSPQGPPPKPKRHLIRNTLAIAGAVMLTLIVAGIVLPDSADPDPADTNTDTARVAQPTSDPVAEPTNGPTSEPVNCDDYPLTRSCREQAAADEAAAAADAEMGEIGVEPGAAVPPPASVSPEVARNILGAAFATNPDTRLDFITDVETNVFELDSVDDITYDQATGQVTIHATSLFGGSDGYYDRNPAEFSNLAWDLMRYVGQDVYGQILPDLDYTGDLAPATPGFTLALDEASGAHTAACPGAFLLRLSQRTADRAAFDAECQLT